MSRLWLLPLLLPTLVSAQDWNPVAHGRKYNYKPDTAQFIQFGVWIDSVRWNVSDSIHFLNRIVVDCDTCPIPGSKLYDQGTFLNRRMQLRADGSTWFHDPGSFVLRAGDSVTSSWLFDTAQNITASIVNLYEDSLFGITDSFKTIALSTGDTIVIGKNLGVVRFPTEDSTNNYILTGIDMGQTDWGETVIDFWDIYGFEVGDVIQFSDGWADGSGSGWEQYDRIIKYEILGRTDLPAGFQYEVARHVWEQRSWQYGPPPGFRIRRCIDTAVISINQSDFENIDSYPNVLCQDSYLVQTPCANPPFFIFAFGETISGRQYKEFYWAEDSSTTAYGKQQNSKVLIPLQSDSCAWLGQTQTQTSYGERMGTITHLGSYFENNLYTALDGYLQDGDSFGELDEDSFFEGNCYWTGVEDPQLSRAFLHPNPTIGTLQVAAEESVFVLHVFDLRGTVMLSNECLSRTAQLDLSSLPPGLYILTATSEEGQLLWAEKVVRQ